MRPHGIDVTPLPTAYCTRVRLYATRVDCTRCRDAIPPARPRAARGTTHGTTCASAAHAIATPPPTPQPHSMWYGAHYHKHGFYAWYRNATTHTPRRTACGTAHTTTSTVYTRDFAMLPRTHPDARRARECMHAALVHAAPAAWQRVLDGVLVSACMQPLCMQPQPRGSACSTACSSGPGGRGEPRVWLTRRGRAWRRAAPRGAPGGSTAG